MKNKITFTLMALGLTLPVANLQAQDTARPERGPRAERPAPAFIGALDANKDRVIDKDEISGAANALKKLDADKDGKLTMRELRATPGRGPGQAGDRPEKPRGEKRPEGQDKQGRAENETRRPQAGPPLIAALDANKDGSLGSEELAGAPAALLKLDKNNDGQLTVEEFQMARGARGGRPGGPDGERPGREGRGPRGESGAPKAE